MEEDVLRVRRTRTASSLSTSSAPRGGEDQGSVTPAAEDTAYYPSSSHLLSLKDSTRNSIAGFSLPCASCRRLFSCPCTPLPRATDETAEVTVTDNEKYQGPGSSPWWSDTDNGLTCGDVVASAAGIVHTSERGVRAANNIAAGVRPRDNTGAGSRSASLEEMLAAEERRARRSRLLHHHLRLEECFTETLRRRRKEAVAEAGASVVRGNEAPLRESNSVARALVSAVRTSAGSYAPLQASPFSRWDTRLADVSEMNFDSLCLLSSDSDAESESPDSGEPCTVPTECTDAHGDGKKGPYTGATVRASPARDVVSRLPALFTVPFDWLSCDQGALFLQHVYRSLFVDSSTERGWVLCKPQPPPLARPAVDDGISGQVPLSTPEQYRRCTYAFGPTALAVVCPSGNRSSRPEADRQESWSEATDAFTSPLTLSQSQRMQRGPRAPIPPTVFGLSSWPARAETVEALHECLLRFVVHASRTVSRGADGIRGQEDRAATTVPGAVSVTAPLCPSCWCQRVLPPMQLCAEGLLEDVNALKAAFPPSVEQLCSSYSNASKANPSIGTGAPLDTMATVRAALLDRVTRGLLPTRRPSPPLALRGFSGRQPLTSSSPCAALVDSRTTDTRAASSMTRETLEEITSIRQQCERLYEERLELASVLHALEAQLATCNREWAKLAARANAWDTDHTRPQQDERDNRLGATADMAHSVHVLSNLPVHRWLFPLSASDLEPAAGASSRGPGNEGFGTILGLRFGLSVVRQRSSGATPLDGKRTSADTAGPSRPVLSISSAMEGNAMPSPEWTQLQESVRRQRLYTQVLLSGPRSAAAAGLQSQEPSPTSQVEKVDAQEVNVACGLLATLIVHLAKLNRHSFRCARFHLNGEHTTIDIVDRIATAAAQRGRPTAGSDASATTATLFNATSLLSFLSPSSSSSLPSARMAGDGGAAAENAAVVVKSSVDFFLNERFFAWKTFGTACEMVLECVEELCDLLRSALQCQQRRLQFAMAHQSQPQHRPQGDSKETSERAPPFSASGTSQVDATVLSVPPKAPYTISGNKIDGFPITHGSVTDAVWTVAATKLIANVMWCSEATTALLQLQNQLTAVDEC